MYTYKGLKECIGCGKTGEESPRASTADICFECKTNLELGTTLSPLMEIRNGEIVYKLNTITISTTDSDEVITISNI